MNAKNQKLIEDTDSEFKDETEEESTGGDALVYDADAFEENIDDIDFDKVDLDDI